MRPKHIKEKREKEVRQIWKRCRKIWQEMRGLGYIKLKKPIRHGWFKEIIITHKVERYKNEADQKQSRWKDYWNLSDRKKEKLKIKRRLNQLKNYDLDEVLKENISWDIN